MGQAPERQKWFLKLEVELTTGRAIRFALTRDEAAELSKRFFIQEDPSDDLALVRAAFTTLTERVEAGTGELVLPGGDGQVWVIPARSVVVFGFEHRLEGTGRPRAVEIGFRGAAGNPDRDTRAQS
jgi:hypothetical protein